MNCLLLAFGEHTVSCIEKAAPTGAAPPEIELDEITRYQDKACSDGRVRHQN